MPEGLAVGGRKGRGGRGGAGGRRAAPPPPAESLWGRRPLPEGVMPEVLVVDDSKVMRDMVVACLRPYSGLNFTHASSGLEAIERLSLQPYDLLVLDLNMPDIGGI